MCKVICSAMGKQKHSTGTVGTRRSNDRPFYLNILIADTPEGKLCSDFPIYNCIGGLLPDITLTVWSHI